MFAIRQKQTPMKNIVALAVFVTILTLLQSCKKDYTCTCKVYDTHKGQWYAGGVYEYTYSKTSKLEKSKASEWCSDKYVGSKRHDCFLN